MKAILIDIILALAVFAVWLGVAGFVRLKAPLDRVHCVTFVNVASAIALLVAALLDDGLSDRVLKLVLLDLAMLWVGAVLAHATGRALIMRGDRE